MNIKNEVRKILFSYLSENSIQNFYKVYYRIKYSNEMMEKRSFGKLNADKTFYVIRPRQDCTEGLLSLFWNVVRNLAFAREHNYIPVVDFLNYKTQYSMNTRENVWEYYFTQPSQYDLEEVYQSKNVILSGLEIQWYRKSDFKVNYEQKILETLHDKIFSYVDFSEETKYRVEEEISHLNIDLDNTIGLYLRGTDYIKLKPSGHPVQPDVNQAVTIIDEYLCKYDISSVFLVTEDGKIYDAIKEKYGKMCVTPQFDNYIYDYDGNRFLSKDKSIEELASTPYERGMNYLVKMIILSKCGYLVGGNTNGMWAANVFANHKFKDRHIFDLGLYGK